MSPIRPLRRCMQCTRHDRITYLSFRTLTTTTDPPSASAPPPPGPPSTDDPAAVPPHRYNPNKVHTVASERKLIANQNQYPIGSRRRRAAIATSTNIPFSQLPYQCFQEARKILQEDRAGRVREIQTTRERIAQLEGDIQKAEQQGERSKVDVEERRMTIRELRKRIEKLKVLADINDPLVKKKFEDGLGDMNKPVYRHLADLKWREYERKVVMQRITQMNVTPDILPSIDPTYLVSMRFGSNPKTPHGEIVPSTISEKPPVLTIQPYDKGERLVTIALINPDVPNVEKDAFDYRCHFLASNIKISPSQTQVDLASLDADLQVLIPWLAPHVQKGLPYQRHAFFVLEQDRTKMNSEYILDLPEAAEDSLAPLDLQKMRLENLGTQAEKFVLKDFVELLRLRPRGVDLFRAVFDEGTQSVMRRAGLVGADVMFKRKRVEPLPYQRLKGSRFR